MSSHSLSHRSFPFSMMVGAILAFAGDALSQCQTASLNKNSGVAQDHFGNAVAIDGEFMVVGADLYDGGAVNTGAVFVYRRLNSAWTFLGQLAPGNLLKAGDQFGVSVAISGGRIIVGAPYSDIAASNAGAAFIFDWIPAAQTWQFAATLVAGSPEADQSFGHSVDVDGNEAVVGAFLDDAGPGFGFDMGAAWRYQRNTNGTWSSGSKLFPTFNASDGDHFGYSVSISGTAIAVGADLNDGTTTDEGVVQIYRKSFSSWQPVQVLTSPDALSTGDQFGVGVALHGDTLAVGAWLDDEWGANAGAVYVYEYFSQDSFSPMQYRAKLGAPVPQAGAQAGWRVSVERDLIAASAVFHDSPGATDAGAVATWRRKGTAWIAESMLIPPLAQAGESIGFGVAVDDPNVVIGAPFRDLTLVDAGRVTVLDYTACNGVYGIPTTLPIWSAGALDLSVHAGPANAGNSYLFLGSASGTNPGFQFGAAHLPLNVDVLTILMATSLGTGGGGLAGILDGAGHAAVSVAVPVNLPVTLNTLPIDFAALVYSPIHASANQAFGPWRTYFRTPPLHPPQGEVHIQYIQGTNEINYNEGPNVFLDGSSSDCFDQGVFNEIEWYLWDFGDKTYHQSTSSTVVHKFATGGNYHVGLTVVDSFGACHFASDTVMINKMAASEFTYPPAIVAGQQGTFDGSLSKDHDGTIVKYIWDFSHETVQTPNKIVTHVFPTWMSGQSVKVRLTVVDDDGLASSNIAEHDVSVQ